MADMYYSAKNKTIYRMKNGTAECPCHYSMKCYLWVEGMAASMLSRWLQTADRVWSLGFGIGQELIGSHFR